VISTSIERTDEKGKRVSYWSKARFRDHDGHVRPMTAFGKNKTTAGRALLQELQDRANTNQSGELTAMHKITQRPTFSGLGSRGAPRCAVRRYSPDVLLT
jgi:hypothetical protein